MMKIIVGCSCNSDIDCWSSLSGTAEIQSADSWCDRRNERDYRRWHTFYAVILERRVKRMWGRRVWKRETHTPSWVPLLFLPPWRRGHWHNFLSLVSLVESRSLFFLHRLHASRSVAWTQNLLPLHLPCITTYLTPNTRGLIAHCTHTHRHTDKDKEAHCDTRAGPILQVTFCGDGGL